MKLKTTKFAMLIISILLISCENGNQVKDNVKSENKDTVSEEVKMDVEESEKLEVPQNKIEELRKSKECFLNEGKIMLPKIREIIGDTITIKKVDDWDSNLQVGDEEEYEAIRKVINREVNFFQINETENFATIGFLEDDVEYLGIYAYMISKANCEILGKELLAESTAWENGYKETFSIFKDDFAIKREKKSGSKDWSDGTKWARDTIITMITFDKKGQINVEKK